MATFLQLTISLMLLSMVIGASYHGLDDYEPDNDDDDDGGDARNEKRGADGCKYPGRACSAGYSYGCYLERQMLGGIMIVSTI